MDGKLRDKEITFFCLIIITEIMTTYIGIIYKVYS